MNTETARQLLALYRPGKESESRVSKAVRQAENDPTLQGEFQEQVAFDQEIIDVIHFIQPPENLRQKLESLTPQENTAAGKVRRNFFNPAILSAVFGVLILMGIAVFLKMESSKNFPGKNWAVDLVQLNERSLDQLTATNALAGELGDNMMLRGFDRFVLPQEISNLPALGYRVFRHSGNKVAQVALSYSDKDGGAEKGVMVYVFRASDFGVYPAEPGTWKVFDYDAWTAAASEQGGLCTLISFRGTNAEMESFLSSHKP